MSGGLRERAACVLAQRVFEIIEGSTNMAIKPKVVDVIMAAFLEVRNQAIEDALQACDETLKMMLEQDYCTETGGEEEVQYCKQRILKLKSEGKP